jgi:hypothetical protein
VRMMQLPMTPERVFSSLKEGRLEETEL